MKDELIKQISYLRSQKSRYQREIVEAKIALTNLECKLSDEQEKIDTITALITTWNQRKIRDKISLSEEEEEE